jgi:hypothetical protein
MGRMGWDAIKRLRRKKRYTVGLLLALFVLLYGGVWILAWRSGQPLKDYPGWLIATAFVAVFVAVFRDVISRLIWFPELDMVFLNAAPYCDDPPETGRDQNGKEVTFPSVWFRPLVINRGTARAEKVEVMVTDVHVPQAGGRPPTSDRQYFLNLAWSNSSGAPRQESAVLIWDGLNPGMRRFVDLGKIYEPLARQKFCAYRENLPGEDGTLFSVLIEYQNTKGTHLLPKGDWQLTLLLSAANHDTLYYRADVHLTGQWVDGIDRMLDPSTGGVSVRIVPIKRKWW